MRSACLLLACWFTLGPLAGTVAGQRPAKPAPRRAAISVQEATDLTNGWALLAEGQADRAAAKAARLLVLYPRSGATLAFAIEAELARGGASAGLAQYERWLGQRTLEEPALLRRVALAMLREEAVQRRDAAARREALRALAEENGTDVATQMAGAPAPATDADTRTLAALGNEEAVKAVVKQLGAGSASQVLAMEALGESGSKLAVAPLEARLADPRQEVRTAALEALGALGDTDAIARITPLLSDRNQHVRVTAAGALLRLGDDSGMSVLQGLLADPEPESRLDAAQAMAGRPDSAWFAVVEELTRADDPQTRAAAARLIAPHNPGLARAVLESLVDDENPAIRDLAWYSIAEVPVTDLAALRRMMRSTSHLAKSRASARVLVVTR